MGHGPRSVDPPALAELRRELPALAELPDDLGERLDLSELLLPEPELAQIRRGLEERLGHHVVTYRSGPATSPAPGALHLCELLQPAALTGVQVAALRAAEASAPGAVLVAYTKPLRLRADSGVLPPGRPTGGTRAAPPSSRRPR